MENSDAIGRHSLVVKARQSIEVAKQQAVNCQNNHLCAEEDNDPFYTLIL